MKILAIDSSTRSSAIAVTDDERVLATYTVDSGVTQSERLLPMVRRVLADARLSLGDIELFAVTTGPGSFTGVRIGVSLVKGLAFGRHIPCAPVSVMAALAQNLVPLDGIYCPVVDARRGQVYNALFRAENGHLMRLCPDRVILATDLAAELQARGTDGPIWLCGDGIATAQQATVKNADAPRWKAAPDALTLPNGIGVARCGLALYRKGEVVDDATLSPVYLRPCQAEQERLEREKQS